MSKDLIDDQFGRYYELPKRLSANRPVSVFCLDYKNRRSISSTISECLSLHSSPITNSLQLISDLRKALSKAPKSILIAGSDAPYCIVSQMLTHRLPNKCIFDIYDDYSTFASAKLPFITKRFFEASQKTSANIAFSKSYADRAASQGIPISAVIPNGVDPTIFKPRKKMETRRLLGLSQNVPIIGYFGAITADRSFNDLLTAFHSFRDKYNDAVFLIAGPSDGFHSLYGPGIDYRGSVSQEHVALLISAVDVATATVRHDNSASICFPTKIMEYVACGTPFVTPDIGDAALLYRDRPEHLYQLNSASDLAQKVTSMLETKNYIAPTLHDWDASANIFEELLADLNEGFCHAA